MPHISVKAHELSLEARLALIDQEIRTLHEFCVNKGYNPWQIESSAKPIFELIKTNQRKTWLNRLGRVAFVIALCLSLYYIDPAYRLICSYSRRASIQMLPYWDWAQYHGEECFVENPYFSGPQLTEDDCEQCETLRGIGRVENISHALISEEYIKRNTPVIVVDGVDDWPAKEKFSIHFLSQLYNEEESLKTVAPCMWGSNIRSKVAGPALILRKSAAGEITKWYAHWDNCDRKAARFLRQFYKRPYFLPPMVELAEPNSLFVSVHHQSKNPKPGDMNKPLVLYVQLKGTVKVILTPRVPCDSKCSKLYATLYEGETLVLTDMLWILDYSPQGSAECIAVGMGGFYD